MRRDVRYNRTITNKGKRINGGGSISASLQSRPRKFHSPTKRGLGSDWDRLYLGISGWKCGAQNITVSR